MRFFRLSCARGRSPRQLAVRNLSPISQELDVSNTLFGQSLGSAILRTGGGIPSVLLDLFDGLLVPVKLIEYFGFWEDLQDGSGRRGHNDAFDGRSICGSQRVESCGEIPAHPFLSALWSIPTVPLTAGAITST